MAAGTSPNVERHPRDAAPHYGSIRVARMGASAFGAEEAIG